MFISIPIIEIGVFILVGDQLGLWPTLLIVLATAIIGVHLLKQQGLKSWQDIQNSTAQGKIPALEMASAAQLLFAGGLLLTPGFVTDAIGFALMVPQIRELVARRLMRRWAVSVAGFSQPPANEGDFHHHDQFFTPDQGFSEKNQANIIEGEFEDKSQ